MARPKELQLQLQAVHTCDGHFLHIMNNEHVWKIVDSTSLQTANLRQYCETCDPVTAALSEHNL